MKKLLLILLCLPMIFSCGEKKDDKIKKLEKEINRLEESIEINIEYINLHRIENQKKLYWRGLLKHAETFRIYLNKGEVITLPAAYTSDADNRLKQKYWPCGDNCSTMDCLDQDICDYRNGDDLRFESLKSNYYYFYFENRLSNGADDEIVDRITEYTFTIE